MSVLAVNERKQYLQDVQNAEAKIKQMEEEFEWIKHEKRLFGQRDQFYDFEQMNISDMTLKAKRLKSEIDDQKKRVNFQVDALVDEQNERYNQLSAKKQTIEQDRDNVLKTIDFLNKQMNDELQDTWKVVSNYTNQIFSTLLPNA